MSPEARPLYEIAEDIKTHWPRMYFAAIPYVNAMARLNVLTDRYGKEDARDIVTRFLVNCQTWHGPDAQRVKHELRKMLADR